MAKKTEMNFEDKMNKLKDIVAELEKENVDLDKSINLYKEGLDLTKSLKEELGKVVFRYTKHHPIIVPVILELK